MVRQPDGQADKAASGKRRRFQPAWPGQPPSWKTKARWTRNTQVGSLGSIIARSSVPGRRDWSRMAASRPGALKPLPLSRACRGYDIQDRQGQEMSDLMLLSDILTSAVSSDNRFLVFWAHQKKSSKMSVSVVCLCKIFEKIDIIQAAGIFFPLAPGLSEDRGRWRRSRRPRGFCKKSFDIFP